MKTTYHTSGFFANEAYSSGLKLFMEQYTDRFPGLNYLHLSLEQVTAYADNGKEQLHYYGEEKCLQIRLVKVPVGLLPTPFEVYDELRLIFDKAVAQHLENHQNELLTAYYLSVS